MGLRVRDTIFVPKFFFSSTAAEDGENLMFRFTVTVTKQRKNTHAHFNYRHRQLSSRRCCFLLLKLGAYLSRIITYFVYQSSLF
jgi:hypothetical protein